MEDEEKINEELKRISPGFPSPQVEIPEGYFEELPDRIVARLRTEHNHKPALRAIWMKLITVAAVLAGLLITVFVMLPKKDVELQPISSLEAYQYIEENIDEFETLLESEVASIPENTAGIEAEIIEEFLMDELEGTDPENYFE